jgi:hypothetical protein
MTELLDTLCLAALVFLSLPLPLFASAALGVRPSARPLLLPWVWGHARSGGALGVLLIATSIPPLVVLAAAGTIFVAWGMQMSRRLARNGEDVKQ